MARFNNTKNAMKSLNVKDYFWSFIAQIVSVCSGLITLPLILHFLSPNEIALNYIFISISALIALFDFGFSSQFGRNFAYIFGGSQEILSVGVKSTVDTDCINYKLLKTLIKTAKLIYTTISLVVLFLLLIVGSLYIGKVTNDFSIIDNVLYIWILYSISLSIDFYFRYYAPLLMGKGLIKESKQIIVGTIFIKSIFISLLLFLDLGLWSIVISTLISTLIGRYFAVRAFLKDGIGEILNKIDVTYREIKTTFDKLWYNAKKLGIVGVATYTSMQLGIFYSGLFLTLNEVAEYGLLLQLVTLIVTISVVPFQINLPYIASLRIKSDSETNAFDEFKLSLALFYFLYFIGGLFLLFIVPLILRIIHSNTTLPSVSMVSVFLLFKFLEAQHCNFSMFLCTKNIVYDFESAIIIGIANVICLFLVLKFTSFGILGIILVQGIIGLCYPNWKWPYKVCKEHQVNFFRLFIDSFTLLFERCKIRYTD